MEKRLKILDKKINEQQNKIGTLNEIIEELSQDEKVIKYISSIKEINDLNILLDKEKVEMKELKIKLCEEIYGDHFFVSNKPGSGCNWQTDTIVTCIHCGYKENINNFIFRSYDREYGNLESEKISIKVHGNYLDSELGEVKKIYDETKKQYAESTDEDIENQISLVKKMKGGKLC